jgi:hypothetical protein
MWGGQLQSRQDITPQWKHNSSSSRRHHRPTRSNLQPAAGPACQRELLGSWSDPGPGHQPTPSGAPSTAHPGGGLPVWARAEYACPAGKVCWNQTPMCSGGGGEGEGALTNRSLGQRQGEGGSHQLVIGAEGLQDSFQHHQRGRRARLAAVRLERSQRPLAVSRGQHCQQGALGHPAREGGRGGWGMGRWAWGQSGWFGKAGRWHSPPRTWLPSGRSPLNP